MRGSQRCLHRRSPNGGIIPAHAGLTKVVQCPYPAFWDHPRACGAHAFSASITVAAWGSSPRMRGSPSNDFHRIIGKGIIPAHAGLTISITSYRLTTRDHPRACGAHSSVHGQWRMKTGSSPRMRGSRVSVRCNVTAFGIIPAHAGLTSLLAHTIFNLWDHPRACGAHKTRL